MTKAEKDLAKAIAKSHYVALSSKTKEDAATKLAAQGLVRVYEQAGALWAKALSRAALDEMASWE